MIVIVTMQSCAHYAPCGLTWKLRWHKRTVKAHFDIYSFWDFLLPVLLYVGRTTSAARGGTPTQPYPSLCTNMQCSVLHNMLLWELNWSIYPEMQRGSHSFSLLLQSNLWWRTALVRENPDERPPGWLTTLMRDQPPERLGPWHWSRLLWSWLVLLFRAHISLPPFPIVCVCLCVLNYTCMHYKYRYHM